MERRKAASDASGFARRHVKNCVGTSPWCSLKRLSKGVFVTWCGGAPATAELGALECLQTADVRFGLAAAPRFGDGVSDGLDVAARRPRELL
jgi:hypothetical protein